jgi:hypothetical protein
MAGGGIRTCYYVPEESQRRDDTPYPFEPQKLAAEVGIMAASCSRLQLQLATLVLATLGDLVVFGLRFAFDVQLTFDVHGRGIIRETCRRRVSARFGECPRPCHAYQDPAQRGA